MNNEINNSARVNERIPIPKRSLAQRLLAVAIIIILLLGGAVIARYLLHNKPKAKKHKHQKSQLLVQVEKLHKINTRVVIDGLGNVMPAKETEIKPEVSGLITSLHPNFHPGGIIKKGEIIAEIDQQNYAIIVREKKAALKQAEAALELEKGQQIVAKHDWQLVLSQNPDLQNKNNDLALRKPQMAQAIATVSLAQAALDQAQLNLKRTKVIAPFTGIVRNKYTDLGSQVSPQTSLITLTGTKSYWLEALIPVRDLHWLGLDRSNSFQAGVAIQPRSYPAVQSGVAGAENNDGDNYNGRIINLLADLDKDGLMSKLLIAVEKPLGNGNKIPLIIGSFVRARITGRPLTGVFKIPRSAVWQSEYVLLVSADNRLQIRHPAIVWQDMDSIYVKDGLHENDNLILSQIAAPIAGMPLKITQK